VERDRIEERNGVADLVRLQRPDEAEADVGKELPQPRPFRLRFLHAVLAEFAMAGIQHRLDRCGIEAL
jgi:hypothetical protein